MKLPMENWLDDQQVPWESITAWREAFVCYKTGANRAALLFSWVGWSLALRHRLLSASRPAKVLEGAWKDLQGKLKKDHTWDDNTFDSTQNETVRYFDVAPQLRKEIAYWRDRRNDCAHYKDNEIIAAHVESFWAFVRSNLPKMAVPGSAEDLRTRVVQHFDPNYTPPSADIKPLIDEIPKVIERNDIAAFLDEVGRLLPRPLTLSLLKSGSRAQREIEFLVGCLVHGTDGVKSAARDMLVKSEKDTAEAMRHDARSIPAFKGKPEVVRAVWKSQLFSNGHQDLEVVAGLLAHGLIPADQQDELNDTIVPKLNNDIPSEPAHRTLNSSGFLKALRKYAFDDGKISQFAWANRNADLLQWLVEGDLTSEQVVKALWRYFTVEPYPRDVRARLAEYFSTHPDKRDLFLIKVSELGLTSPVPLVGTTLLPRPGSPQEE